MKHIRVVGKLAGNTMKIVIVEQTHRGVDLGDTITQGVGVFFSGGCAIVSSAHPQFYTKDGLPRFMDGKADIALYTRGANKGGDNMEVSIPLGYWPRVKAAIEAYNEHFSDKPKEEPKPQIYFSEEELIFIAMLTGGVSGTGPTHDVGCGIFDKIYDMYGKNLLMRNPLYQKYKAAIRPLPDGRNYGAHLED